MKELENQNLVVLAWRLDTKITAEMYVDAVDDLVYFAKKEVFDKFREILEEHRKVSMIGCPEHCFCYDIDTELMKEELKSQPPNTKNLKFKRR